MEVHPLAARFPMMAEHELAELAESIATNGLLQPIVVQGELLIDGRNRLAACEIAGVEPHFEQLNGVDAVEYILGSNVARRHLNAGQRAIAAAFAYPEPEKGGRGKKGGAKQAEKLGQFSSDRLTQARRILRYSEEVAAAVLAGDKSFDVALADVNAMQQAAQSDQAKVARLRAGAPDLAARYDEGMDLDEALAAMNAREQRLIETRQSAKDAVVRLRQFSGQVTVIELGIKAGATDLFDDDLIETLEAEVARLRDLLEAGYAKA